MGDHDLGQFAHPRGQGFAANQQLFPLVFDITASGHRIVAPEGVENLLEGQFIG